MGIIKQGILGGFSGKVGSVIGTSWKGRAVMKAMPLSVANPRTAGQVGQRSKLAAVVAFAKVLLASIIARLDNPFSGNISGYNRFVKRNIAAFTSAGVFIPSDFHISQGVLENFVSFGATAYNASNDVTVQCLNRVRSVYGLLTDSVVVAIYNQTQDVWGVGEAIAANDANTTFNVTMPTACVTGDDLICYMACIRADKKYASNDLYFIETV